MIARRIVASAQPSDETPGQVAREFRGLLDDGARLRPAGEARGDPLGLLSAGHTPKYKVELFDTTFYLTNVRQNPELTFFVAYVVQGDIYPRIFYKDISLIWRCASHHIVSDEEHWIGKGEVITVIEGEQDVDYTVESTTDLPLEIQTALETLSRKVKRARHDEAALDLVLRLGGSDRLEPYRDFTEPRRRASANPTNLINGGASIADFTRKNDPSSLEFVAGFEPDLEDGIIETSASTSRMYGGRLRRDRILSRNREVQYLFFSGPRQVWIIPPQALTTEISSYGIRTIDVIADEDAFIPGYEYHFIDDTEDPPELVSQIPEGFVGEASELDGSRADASPWLDRLPVIQEFRKKVLAEAPDRRERRAS